MRIGPTIHCNAGRNYIHTYIIVQELMNLQLCVEIGGGFPFQFCHNHNAGHNYVHVHVNWYRCCLKKHTSGTVGFAPENYNEPQFFR